MKEASRLLRKSIIRVEIPDINLGEGAPPTQEGVQKDVEMDGAADAAQEEPMTLSWDDYQRIANLFVLKLRQEEEQAEQLGNVRLNFYIQNFNIFLSGKTGFDSKVIQRSVGYLGNFFF